MVRDSSAVARAHLAEAGVDDLPDDWDVVTLGDLFTEDRGIAVGVMYPGDHVPCGVPLIKAGDLNGSIINPRPDFRISEEKHYEYRRTALEGGELLMTLVGNVGQCAVVPPRMAGWNAARAVAVMRLADSSETQFVQQCLLSRPLQHLMDVWCNTTVQATLNLKEIRQLPLPWPPKPCRDSIAAFGKALDDKIELNRRMNATLEAMARALFQSWFVDFDPVRAKLDGRQPAGLDEATAALFPSTFEDSSFGPIPKGWTMTTLGEACAKGDGNIQTGPFGTQLHAADYVEDGIPSIMPSDLLDNRIDTDAISRIREEDAQRLSVYRVRAGDIVYSRRGDVERRSLIRRAEDGWLCGTGCLRVRFGSRGLNSYFGACYLGTPESRAWVVRHAVGATMPNLNTSILGALPLIVPAAELQAAFAEIVGPWDERGTIALEQSRTLATLRDTLLPKLLSGDLSVRNLENFAEAEAAA